VRVIVPGVVAVCAALAAAPASADLKIGLMPAYNSIPLVVAAEAGLYDKAGVRVELVPFSSQLERETALQTGSIDGTVSDMINAIQSWSRGFGARVTSVTEGGFSLLAAPTSSLRSVADWRRTTGPVRTGLLEDSIVNYLSERMLQSAGADPSRIELVPILQLPVRLEMLLAGKVEAACLPEPLATLAVARGAVRLADSEAVVDPAVAMPSGPVGVLLFTRRALDGKKAEVKAFYGAYDRAVSTLASNPGAYRDAIINGCGFPPSVKAVMQIPPFHSSFLPSPLLVVDVGRWMMQKGLVNRMPSYADIVAPGFASADAHTP
jgi:NitT/TauT family transport system substrate-binding protein